MESGLASLDHPQEKVVTIFRLKFLFDLRDFSTHIVRGKQHEIVQDWRIPRKEGRSSTPLSTPPLLASRLLLLLAFATTSLSTQRRIIGENTSKKTKKSPPKCPANPTFLRTSKNQTLIRLFKECQPRY